MSDWKQIRDGFKANPAVFVGSVLAAVAWAAGYVYFGMNAEWPASCDHSGRKFIGMVKQAYCSPGLLSGGPMEWGLFAFIWSVPAFLLGLAVWVWIVLRKKNVPQTNRNAPPVKAGRRTVR